MRIAGLVHVGHVDGGSIGQGHVGAILAPPEEAVLASLQFDRRADRKNLALIVQEDCAVNEVTLGQVVQLSKILRRLDAVARLRHNVPVYFLDESFVACDVRRRTDAAGITSYVSVTEQSTPAHATLLLLI